MTANISICKDVIFYYVQDSLPVVLSGNIQLCTKNQMSKGEFLKCKSIGPCKSVTWPANWLPMSAAGWLVARSGLMPVIPSPH